MLDRLVRGTRMPFGTITPIYRSTQIDNIYSKKGQPCPAPHGLRRGLHNDRKPEKGARRRVISRAPNPIRPLEAALFVGGLVQHALNHGASNPSFGPFTAPLTGCGCR